MSNPKSDGQQILPCPSCATRVRVPNAMAGKSATCPACGNLIPVSSGASVTFGTELLQARSVLALWLIRGTMAVMAIHGVIHWRLYEAGPSQLLSAAQGITFVLQLLMIVATAILFLRWKYQASVNLHHACKRPLKFSPAACCWHYFIPVLNLVYPMRAMLEIQSRSKAGVGYMVCIWWAIWILSGILTRLTFNTGNVKFEALCVVSIAALSLSIIAGFFLTKIIQTVTEKQRRYGLAIAVFEN